MANAPTVNVAWNRVWRNKVECVTNHALAEADWRVAVACLVPTGAVTITTALGLIAWVADWPLAITISLLAVCMSVAAGIMGTLSYDGACILRMALLTVCTPLQFDLCACCEGHVMAPRTDEHADEEEEEQAPTTRSRACSAP